MEDKFIKSLYDLLLKENIVTKQASMSKEKKELADAYFEKIERVNEKVREQEERIRRIKELYYKRYVIKESDISENYWRYLEEEYLDEGQGHVNLVNPTNEIERELKREHTRRIIEAQKSSIDGWLNYFMSSDSDYLPMWGKVWAFMGMVKIGVLNKEKSGFNKRSKDTVEPFISIDSELVGKSIEYLKKHLKRERLEDEELARLVRSESFKTIYEYLYLNKKEMKKKTTRQYLTVNQKK